MTELVKAVGESELVYRLGWTLLHTVWLGAGVGALFALLLLVLRRRSANARYLAACAAMILMVAAPAMTFFLVHAPGRVDGPPGAALGATAASFAAVPGPESAAPWRVGVAPAPSIKSPRNAGDVPPVGPTELKPPPAPAQAAAPGANTPWLSIVADTLEPVLPWVVLAWAAGVMMLSVWQLCGWIAAGRLKRLATLPGEPALVEEVARLARVLRVSRPVKLLESMLVRVPTVLGWLRPVILLPAGLATGLTPQQMQAILAHELAHIRRYDYMVNLLQTLAETLLFYHPATWFISRQLRAERENCCDDIAVAAGAEPFSYAESLLHVVRQAASQPRTRSAGFSAAARAAGVRATGPASQLRNRITRLLGDPEDTTRRARTWPIALIIIAAIAVSTLLVNCGIQRPGPIAAPPTPATQPAKELVLDLGNNVSMKLVLIPAGKFMMGSPKDEKESSADQCKDADQHEVAITKPFYMGIYPVTQDQYLAVMGKNPSYFKGAQNPVEEVTWDDAAAFCKKLSGTTGKTVQLPTEAQWEYACRAGTQTPFNTGVTITSAQANYEGSCLYGPRWVEDKSGVSRGRTTPVGSFKPNAWGLYDMHGNVWQYCSDWYAEIPCEAVATPPASTGELDENDVASQPLRAPGRPLPATDPTGPAADPSPDDPWPLKHVIRGGCFQAFAWTCRSAYREGIPAGGRYTGGGGYFGFRVVVVDLPATQLASAPATAPATGPAVSPIPSANTPFIAKLKAGTLSLEPVFGHVKTPSHSPDGYVWKFQPAGANDWIELKKPDEGECHVDGIDIELDRISVSPDEKYLALHVGAGDPPSIDIFDLQATLRDRKLKLLYEMHVVFDEAQFKGWMDGKLLVASRMLFADVNGRKQISYGFLPVRFTKKELFGFDPATGRTKALSDDAKYPVKAMLRRVQTGDFGEAGYYGDDPLSSIAELNGVETREELRKLASVEKDPERKARLLLTARELDGEVVVTGVRLDYDYPTYTGKPHLGGEDGGIRAVAGTAVTIYASTNKLAGSAELLIDGKPVSNATRIDASCCTFKLVLKPGLRGQYSIRVAQKAPGAPAGQVSYTTAGQPVEATPDMPPSIEIKGPTTRPHLKPGDKLTINYNAGDDFGVAAIELLITADGQSLPPRQVDIRGGAPVLDLSDEKLKNAKRISYQFRVTDNLPADTNGPRRALSQVFTVDVDAPTTAPVTGSATQPAGDMAQAQQAAKDYAQRVGALLPKGWSVKTVADTLLIARDREVRGRFIWPSMGPLFPGEEWAQPQRLEIALRVGPRIAPDERRRLIAENSAAAAQWHKEHPNDFAGKLQPPVKHNLPTHYDDTHSFWLLAPYNFDFESKEDGREYNGVCNSIEALFHPYEPASAGPATAPATRPAGGISPDDGERLRQKCLDSPDLTGPLGPGLKIRAQADTWKELVANAKPMFTWGQPELAGPLAQHAPDQGFPDMMWIEDAAAKPVFRVARAFTWKPAGQKTRWVLVDLNDGAIDRSSRDQIQGRPMPERLEVVKGAPISDGFVSYAILKASDPHGGAVYEVGWAPEMCDGTGHYRFLRLLYVWRTPAGEWKLLGEGPQEEQSHYGVTSCESTVRWKGDPARPVVSFVIRDWSSEADEEPTGRPDVTVCRDGVLDAAGGSLPAIFKFADVDYIVAQKGDTLDKITCRLAAGRGWVPNTEVPRNPEENRQAWRKELARLNPKLTRVGTDPIPEGTSVVMSSRSSAAPSATQPATAPATRPSATQAGGFDEQYAAARKASPPGVALEMSAPKGTYHVGEKIPVTLKFSNASTQLYQVWAGTYDRSGRISDVWFAVDGPGGGWADPLGEYFSREWAIYGGGLGQCAKLGEHAQTFDMNEWVRFDKPGVYRCYCVTTRVQADDGKNEQLPVVSQIAEFKITPADEAFVQATVAQARRDLDDEKLRGQAVRTLRFLATPEAVDMLAGLTDDSQVAQEAMFGLIGARDRAGALQILRKKLDDPDVALNQTLETAIVELTLSPQDRINTANGQDSYDEQVAALAHLEERGAAIEQKKARIAAELAAYVAKGLDRKRGRALASTCAHLLFNAKMDNPQLRRSLAANYSMFTPDERVLLLNDDHWPLAKCPEFEPILAKIVAQPLRGEDWYWPGEQSLALLRYCDFQPQKARALILADIRQPQPKLSAKAALSLPADALPADFDVVLLKNLTSKDKPEPDRYKVVPLIEQYGTKAILPGVLAYYREAEGRWPCEIEDSFLRFWIKQDRPAGLEALVRVAKSHQTGCYKEVLLHTLGGNWQDDLQKLLLPFLDDPSPDAAAQAAQLLGEHGDGQCVEPMIAALARRPVTTDRAKDANRNQLEGRCVIIAALANGKHFQLTPQQRSRITALFKTDDEKWQFPTTVPASGPATSPGEGRP